MNVLNELSTGDFLLCATMFALVCAWIGMAIAAVLIQRDEHAQAQAPAPVRRRPVQKKRKKSIDDESFDPSWMDRELWLEAKRSGL